MYIKLTNGTPSLYSLRQLRRDNPNTSFPKIMPDELLASYDVYPYTRSTQPTINAITQNLVEGAFEQDVDGNWSRPWVVEAKSQSELDSDLADWRGRALLYRRDFCIALKRAGILPVAEAIAAAKGDWPTTFETALSSLTQDEQDEAQIEWASVIEIRRNHPMIAMLGVAAGMADAQVDALFGRVA
tara:strand:- start:1909 stop:2466 length:558 start_codon:yes stop_codon:yes gene_type:complete